MGNQVIHPAGEPMGIPPKHYHARESFNLLKADVNLDSWHSHFVACGEMKIPASRDLTLGTNKIE